MYAFAVSVAPISVEEAFSSTPASLTAPADITASEVVADCSFTPALAVTLMYLPWYSGVSARVLAVWPSITANVPYFESE